MRFVLMLNDMREANIENLHAVAVSEDRDELVQMHDACRVAPYNDEQWLKSFRPGTALEWCNPAEDLDNDGAFFGGIYKVPDGFTGDPMAVRLVKS